MLHIEGLKVEVAGKEILHGIDLHVPAGETHTLFGPNGSGKTTLLNTIMGLSQYQITAGTIRFAGHDITHIPTYERARLGIGLSFQRPPTIHGVKTRDMVRIAAGGREVDVDALAHQLNMEQFLGRDVNAGFSGGEIKRSELLQLLARHPDMVLLDEPESGVDLENMALIGSIIAELLHKDRKRHRREKSGLIITHTGFILDYLEADKGYVMCNGTIKCHGIPRELLSSIREHGYEECIACRI
ncbi:MAG: ABC transporter ATP-binding protein [Chloroflexi bacterium]|nr:ABC transporter ATP-binding protein [Chloroflexota bacterium]MBU1749054.1 ABC transporter ATP-binding protein [Chloroflexota bacterium]